MDNFSTMMVIGECLLDKRRTAAFGRAIKETVKPGDVVLDGGTGSAIMALTAAKAGAKKVYAVEIDLGVSKWARKNVENNNYADIVEVVHKDLKNINLPHLDVVIMEMMDTGLVFEHQAPAMNQLVKSGAVDKNTKLIPSQFETYVEFVNYDFDFYGFKMPFIIQARNFGVQEKITQKLTGKILINKIDFHYYNKLAQNVTIDAVALNDGVINSLVLTSKIKLSQHVASWGTTDMNMPCIIPVPELVVKKGQALKFNIVYKMAHGFDKFKFNWVK